MRLKKRTVFILMSGLLLVLSCTSSPWHREQADMYLKKGIAFIEAGQYIGALKELLEADKYSPDDPDINYYLGVAYLGRGLRDYALERFQKAVAARKNYSEAHNYIGVIYMDMGQWEKAVESFDRALGNYLYTTPALAYFNSGWAYYNLKKYPEALARYQQASRNDVSGSLRPQIEKNVGLIYMDQSMLVPAIDHFKKAVELDPAMVDAHFFLGECYLQIKDQSRARLAFQEVVRLSPQSAFGQKARNYLHTLR